MDRIQGPGGIPDTSTLKHLRPEHHRQECFSVPGLRQLLMQLHNFLNRFRIDLFEKCE